MPRGQGQTNKVALIVVADRTLGGRLLPLVDVAAVEADPAHFHVVHKKFSGPQLPGKELETLGVGLFYLRDLAEMAGHCLKPFLLRLPGKRGMYRIPFLRLVGLRKIQKLRHILRYIYRIMGTCNQPAIASSLLQMRIKHLGVGPLLVCGVEEYGLDQMQALLLGSGRSKSISIPRLAKARSRFSRVTLSFHSMVHLLLF